MLWAMEKQLKKTNFALSKQIRSLRKEFLHEFGLAARLTNAMVGPFMLWTSRREEKRLARGVTYEPPMFLERTNWSAS